MAITFTQDPDSALSEFQRNGFFIEPDLFSEDVCLRLIDAANDLPSARDGSLTPVMNPHRINPVFEAPMRNPALLRIMERILGGRVRGLQTQFFFGRPGTQGFTIHQDNFYVRSPHGAFGSAWLALTDVDPENGSLVVYPGSHREALLDVTPVEQPSTFGQDPNANCQEAKLPPGYNPLSVTARRGSVVLIHGHVAHSSHDNTSTNRFRHVLLMTYVREGVDYRTGFAAKREAFDVYDDAATG
ncbi:phytanoyl-CoA dioxygenase family protein [Azospirillum sp. RWY-5-1]|uniref:Phytanoyl-CoA dioxygenase family protein n=1 Tax=Azospirillum oleiclasticum TaxID=2735135 RepID=A0ABX2TMU5_9PROT|nr:phytanoyl-CoA dioxygenase family protein [Azospirillum oleiclasticum]NYZ17511.1 phytanoyl-CoA dioxygenase family protein [Azospirillum oleiclasticum]NYZ24889.1 phytanoyl-CoA dioxygenase family protein [Azospirillum oleiclasticum]